MSVLKMAIIRVFRNQRLKSITLPLSKPIITYTLLTAFMTPWVDYIFAKVIMGSDTQYYTIAIGKLNDYTAVKEDAGHARRLPRDSPPVFARRARGAGRRQPFTAPDTPSTLVQLLSF